MASAVYPKALEAFLKANIDLDAVAVNAVLLDLATYTYNAAHDFYTTCPAWWAAQSGDFASKTYSNGVFDAADIRSLQRSRESRSGPWPCSTVDRGWLASADNLLSLQRVHVGVDAQRGATSRCSGMRRASSAYMEDGQWIPNIRRTPQDLALEYASAVRTIEERKPALPGDGGGSRLRCPDG
jgi:hypothetical protein